MIPLRAKPILLAVGCLLILSDAAVQAQGGMSVGERSALQRIRPGDHIELRFMRDADLNTLVTVSERGDAIFPKLGTIDLASVTIGELRDTLTTRYSEYLRAPELQVNVLRRIIVNGHVRAPDVYYLDVTSSLRDAIAKAGGLLDVANRRNVAIIRRNERIKVRDWDTASGPQYDLQSGDQIFVGKQPWLVLNALPVISTSFIVIGLIRSLRQ